ncbi:MAG TPA: DUF2520 domain-containing protein [Flavipsychrobacter sp.]|nr:DUF2520 domain-containing protein [Flavipsychrobacter sp.]
MTYYIIGTGNTAWFMATKLHAAGHLCKGIYGRDITKAEELANTINANAYELIDGIPDNADVCILAVSDSAIEEISGKLSFNNTLLLHTAGAVSSSVLKDAAKNYGVIWPIYSITKHQLPETRNIPSAIEINNTDSSALIHTIAASFTDSVYEADSDKRKQMHLAAVFSNNFSNHLFAVAEKMCAEHGIPFNTMIPIIAQTAKRINSQSPSTLQTGPAKRNDTATMQEHLQLLNQHPEWEEMYKSISASILKMYSK